MPDNPSLPSNIKFRTPLSGAARRSKKQIESLGKKSYRSGVGRVRFRTADKHFGDDTRGDNRPRGEVLVSREIEFLAIQIAQARNVDVSRMREAIKLAKSVLETVAVNESNGIRSAALIAALGEVLRGSEKPVKPAHTRKKQRPLPILPDGLHWPTVMYRDVGRGTSIVEFLELYWKDLISAGFGEMRWLRQIDPTAVHGVENYERLDPKSGVHRSLPDHLRILRERQVTDLELEGCDIDKTLELGRLSQAARYRSRLDDCSPKP